VRPAYDEKGMGQAQVNEETGERRWEGHVAGGEEPGAAGQGVVTIAWSVR